MRIIFLWFSIFSIFIFGCKSKRQVYYNEFKKDINIEIFQKFPLSEKQVVYNDELKIFFPNGMSSLNYCGIVVSNQLIKSDIEMEIKLLLKKYKSLKNINFTSSSKLYFEDDTLSYNIDTFFISKEYLQHIDHIFLINGKSGYFFNSDLPKITDSQHGFVSLILINTKKFKKFHLIKIW